MIVFNTFDTDMSFWDLYPELKIALSFKSLYKSDKSRGKDVSSKKMWFIVLTNAPNSRFINIPEKERYEIIGEDFMGNPNYYKDNKDVLEPLKEDLLKLIDTPSARHLRQWVKTLEDRTNFLRDVSYDLNNYDKLDKMAANTSALMETFKKINDALTKEAGAGDIKGGGRESLNDTGEI